MPRHFDSHANVRSTTQRRGLCPFDRSHAFFSSPIRRMCGVYPASVAAARPLGLSYALSRLRCCSCSAGSGRSTTTASIVAFKSFCSTTFAPAVTTPSGPPSPSVRRLFLVPFLPRSVGFLPTFFPPEPGLAQHRVGTLPLPLHAAEFVALGDQHRPDLLEDAPLDPALEPVVDGALGAEPLGQLVPLAAAPHPEEDRVEHLAPVGDPATRGFLGQKSLRIGSMRCHNSSGISQMVPNGLRRDLRRAMAVAPVAGYGARLWRYNLLRAKGVP